MNIAHCTLLFLSKSVDLVFLPEVNLTGTPSVTIGLILGVALLIKMLSQASRQARVGSEILFDPFSPHP